MLIHKVEIIVLVMSFNVSHFMEIYFLERKDYKCYVKEKEAETFSLSLTYDRINLS